MLPVVRIPAHGPGAVQRPGRKDAPLVNLAAYQADDRDVRQIPWLRGIPHAREHSPPRRSARTEKARAQRSSPPLARACAQLVDALAVLVVDACEDRGGVPRSGPGRGQAGLGAAAARPRLPGEMALDFLADVIGS